MLLGRLKTSCHMPRDTTPYESLCKRLSRNHSKSALEVISNGETEAQRWQVTPRNYTGLISLPGETKETGDRNSQCSPDRPFCSLIEAGSGYWLSQEKTFPKFKYSLGGGRVSRGTPNFPELLPLHEVQSCSITGFWCTSSFSQSEQVNIWSDTYYMRWNSGEFFPRLA